MKLDSAPLSIACISQPESKPELKDDTDSNSTAQETVSLLEEPSLEVSSTIEVKSPVEVLRPSPTHVLPPQKHQSATEVFFTTFVTIFLAEIGDKTQLSTLLMSAQSHSPWVVFLGSGAALVTTSLLGVVLGSWIANRLSPKIVEKAAGMVLLLISVLLFWDVIFIQH